MINQFKEINADLNIGTTAEYYNKCKNEGYSSGTCIASTIANVATNTVVSAASETMIVTGAAMMSTPVTAYEGTLAVSTGITTLANASNIGKASGELVKRVADLIVNHLQVPIDTSRNIIVQVDDFIIEFTHQETEFIYDVILAKNYTMDVYNHLVQKINDMESYINFSVAKINENKEIKAVYDEKLKIIKIELDNASDDLKNTLNKYHENYFNPLASNNYTSAHTIIKEPEPIAVKWGGDVKGGGTGSRWTILIPIVSFSFSTGGFCNII